MTERLDIIGGIDPVTFEVVRHGLVSICEEMKGVIMRAAFSPLLSLSADLSCAILDASGEVVAQGNDIPVHLGAMPFTARGMLERFPPRTWSPGDAVLANDPYLGGTHLPDMTLMSPIHAGREVIGFAACRVHWPDVGGIASGSSSVSDHILKEGIRVPPLKAVCAGEVDEGLIELLLANMRRPADRYGDFRAQNAGNQRGVSRVSELIARYGAENLRAIFAATQAHSQALVEEGLKAWPDGNFFGQTELDGDGFETKSANEPLKIAVTISKRGPRIAFDFTGSSGACRGPMNAPFAVTASAVYYTLLAISGGDAAPNSGAYRPASIIATEGSLLNAKPPSPVVAANTETSNRLVDLLLTTLGQAMPELVAGESYGSAGVYTIGGYDPLRNRPFVHYETLGGGMGASAIGDGLGGMRVHMGNTMNLPIEAMEAAMPVRFETYELIAGSGGDGGKRGGQGVRKSFRALASGLDVSILCERASVPAQGIAGGKPGRAARFRCIRRSGDEIPLSSKTGGLILDAGDLVILETAGGGGFGTPTDSD